MLLALLVLVLYLLFGPLLRLKTRLTKRMARWERRWLQRHGKLPPD